MGYALLHMHAWERFQQRLIEFEAQCGYLEERNARLEERNKLLEERFEQELMRRTKMLARTLEFRNDETARELASCQADLARADGSGRIMTLEHEVQRLRTRVADLEAYLKATRAEGVNYLL